VVQIDAKNLLVIGPSSGGGGGGSSIDATTIFQTGDVIWLDQAGPRAGWVRDNGRTVGSASSGASERANADCQPLFTFLWQTYADSVCPVPGGRGGSAAADWSANKQITLPDKRGRGAFGLDDMGNAVANALSGVAFSRGSSTTAGSLGGEANHTLQSSEVPATTVSISITDPGHSHIETVTAGNGGASVPDTVGSSGPQNSSARTATAVTGVTASGTVQGGGAGHNNMPPFVLGTFYRKL
jgi:microcystin-dependent protein